MVKGQKKIRGNFVELKCPDCSNKQVLFLKCATRVACQTCGSTLAIPTGGKCITKGEIVGVVE